uniref:Ribosomal protein L32 n=15 Tax=Epimedium TaxID=63350 RepID=A0A7L8Y5D0_9MAGN|nr:ribosomal protein L32 [Epimedium acuminatum]YP_009246934.1 ribosomal protein L32 [Epimedium lishihchenii]YP_009700720.1 ribosomal protein L32 [Epimedium borealiguizhouense]YP_009700803.1 ribosomal protein L32 [Epimedium mikinorii]YP_009700886.1 ribosomal protein L32 [Epimedium wushanense]YP_009701275.1 ribosomal protein L32 [Epimedium ilicifolium]YP_009746458.1 ribosomal protein L32 [Epimedium brevicornu]YP_010014444.1 ribosomal protein L32 [Epimedium parvifolium]YP_010015314.1 ribosomal
MMVPKKRIRQNICKFKKVLGDSKRICFCKISFFREFSIFFFVRLIEKSNVVKH